MRFPASVSFVCLIATFASLLLASAGCRSGVNRSEEPRWVQQLAELPYPEAAEYGDDLDMNAYKQGRELVIVSREPRSYENVQLWLNRQYVTVVERIDAAGRLEAPLSYFINEHGEPFPVGWLLAPEEARPVLTAEVYNPATGTRHRLVARTQQDVFGD